MYTEERTKGAISKPTFKANAKIYHTQDTKTQVIKDSVRGLSYVLNEWTHLTKDCSKYLVRPSRVKSIMAMR